MVTEEDVIQFYRVSYFGRDTENLFEEASTRAYRDMCRTIVFTEKREHSHNREVVTDELRALFLNLNQVATQEQYDEWHSSCCHRILRYYTQITKAFSYGQAQKWVNMLMKYMLVLRDREVCRLEPFLHVPIDNIIIEAGLKAGIHRPAHCWSQMEEGEYLDYQSRLKAWIGTLDGNKTPIEWEFGAWASPFLP